MTIKTKVKGFFGFFVHSFVPTFKRENQFLYLQNRMQILPLFFSFLVIYICIYLFYNNGEVIYEN